MFEVGQKVRVISRKRLQEIATRRVDDGEVSWSLNGGIMFDFMVAECGHKSEIDEVITLNASTGAVTYELVNSDWFWDEWMLEPVE